MLAKARHPHLNREQRRHPNRNKVVDLGKGGMNWLLTGLMIHAGYMSPEYTEAAANRRAKEAAAVRPEGKSVLARVKQAVGRWLYWK